MVEDGDTEKRKAHRSRQSGVKAEKKKLKKDKFKKPENGAASARERNPKAFAINSAIRAERNFRRKEDLTAKKQHIPVVDQTSEEPPPDLIAIVGPPKVGKTTLISNLIKMFTKTNVNDIRGPITIVTSKKRRITLLECNNDVNTMIDVAKCADLVLLLIDASYGFEMEIFEFLNICQVHGMPKIMGVLTHLDMMKNPMQIRKRKKELKHRFWTEVYNGAKLFYLSGLLHGEYLRNEIQNLGRFISVMKYRPLQWRGAHSYLLVDRVEDITNSQHVRSNPSCDREVVLYGYVRGVPLKKEHMVHIAGVGDMRIDELNVLQDPCPLPGTEKKRSLLEKERLLYAPMSGVGGLVYDKDAVYIELSGSHSHQNRTEGNEEKDGLMEKLIKKKQTVDEQTDQQEFRIFSDGSAIKSKDFNSDNEMTASEDSDAEIDDDEDENEDEEYEDDTKMLNSDAESNAEQSDMSADSQSSDDEDINSFEDEEMDDNAEERVNHAFGGSSWKQNLMTNARESFLQRHSESRNLMRLVYGSHQNAHKKDESKSADADMAVDEDDGIGSLFRAVTDKQKELNQQKALRNNDECCFFTDATDGIRNWLEEPNKLAITNCFVTGKWKASEDAENLLKMDQSDAESELYGDFEDLEAEQNPTKAAQSNGTSELMEPPDVANKLIEKKLMLKEKFNSEYDKQTLKDEHRIVGDHEFYESLKAEALKQTEINKNEFKGLDADERLQVEGYRAGLYVRLGFKNFPPEFIENFDASYPVLVGGLNAIEENIGYVHCKVKKHRWYKKILKSADPLIISLGWRRFQTVPIYAKIEDNFRFRFLKYTPNHVTCAMTFWGPITPQNTGFLALQSVRHNIEEIKRIGFRIAATGSVMEVDKSAQIMKKLKLVGEPFKIYKKSAFIKGMFTSSLEVAKFEGAKIKTVSGIRGQIKKAHHTPEGSFRATFEDKILLSDIIFCRTWFRVDVPRFYTPLTSLLLPPEQKSEWQGMKTLGQLKREKQIRNEAQPDSAYTEIKRQPKIFKKLAIPKALQRALPYKDKPKYKAPKTKPTLDEQRVAVIRSPHEQKVAKLMKVIETNFRDKRQRDKTETKARLKKFKAEKSHEELRKLKRQKELRKKVSRALSKIRKKEQT